MFSKIFKQFLALLLIAVICATTSVVAFAEKVETEAQNEYGTISGISGRNATFLSIFSDFDTSDYSSDQNEVVNILNRVLNNDKLFALRTFVLLTGCLKCIFPILYSINYRLCKNLFNGEFGNLSVIELCNEVEACLASDLVSLRNTEANTLCIVRIGANANKSAT